jgi:dienelactone hydrolase
MRLPSIRISMFALGLSLATACAESDVDSPECTDPLLCPVYTTDASSVLPGGDAGGFVSLDSGLAWPVADAAGDTGSVLVTGDASSTSDANIASDGSAANDGSASADSSVPPSASHIRGPEPTKEIASNKGPYKVMSYTNGFRDAPGYADATIYYPTDADAPFSIVAVVPGFVSAQSSIQPWGPFLASHGIVAITIGTNSGTDLPKVRAEALLDALATLKSEGKRAASPLSGKIDESRMGVMGWSMGGGGTMWAATAHPELKAAISLCGWETGPQFQKNTVPSLLLSATGDTVAPTGSHATPFYNQIPATTPKLLLQVQGGSHSSANDPASHNKVMGLFGLSWMKVFLEGDERYRPFLKMKPSEAALYQTTL